MWALLQYSAPRQQPESTTDNAETAGQGRVPVKHELPNRGWAIGPRLPTPALAGEEALKPISRQWPEEGPRRW